jgi:hypothetical protein
MMNQNPKVQKKHNLQWLVDLAQDASVGKVVNVLGTGMPLDSTPTPETTNSHLCYTAMLPHVWRQKIYENIVFFSRLHGP